MPPPPAVILPGMSMSEVEEDMAAKEASTINATTQQFMNAPVSCPYYIGNVSQF